MTVMTKWLCHSKERKTFEHKKRATEVALARKKRGLLALLLRCLSLLSWSLFLLLGWLVELGCDEDNSVV